MFRKGLIFFSLMMILSCKESTYVPKPIAYPKIDLPQFTQYQSFNSSCPYQFEYPNYIEIVKDTFFFGEEVSSNCWINMVYPSLNAKIHFSYKVIGQDISLEKVMQDSHELAYTHSKKADYIDEFEIENPNGVKGLMTDIGGDAANNIQFYLTDYEKHYLRGAVYFSSHPNADSLQPALEFIKKDMMHFFETFAWKE
jgi:gliding motility-associated lipoprotein GldD